jgi:hypothetical protein
MRSYSGGICKPSSAVRPDRSDAHQDRKWRAGPRTDAFISYRLQVGLASQNPLTGHGNRGIKLRFRLGVRSGVQDVS